MEDVPNQTVLKEFVSECDEIVQNVTETLRLIEKDEATTDSIDQLYRDIHTLKGSSQLFGFKELGDIAHSLETSLDPIRRHRKKVSSGLLDSFYLCLDCIEKIIKEIQQGHPVTLGPEIERAIPLLIQHSVDSFGIDFKADKEIPGFGEINEKFIAPGEEKMINTTPKRSEIMEVEKKNLTSPSNPTSKNVVVKSSDPKANVPTTAGQESPASSETNSTIRVSVNLLDKLMTLMGEMVLVRNQVLQYSNQRDDLEFLNLSQRLDLVTSELQGEVMKTRMQPIGNILSKFQRVVRDLGKELGKDIELSLLGVSTELDKTLLESIKDPLTHIVRNSCDHGIESKAERREAGKSETGHVQINAFHEGGQVIIEVSDDGKGLDREKIIEKAISRGITTLEKASQMSDRDVFNFIFSPGFSTAAKVTNVSGRGVGMDVVKSNIDRIGGQVELSSQLGKSMTVRLKIPLTLAIVPAMIVRCGENCYAIPQVKLVELVRLENNGSLQNVETLQGKPMYRLRGNLLPLVNLKEIMGLKSGEEETSSVVNVVVLQGERQLFGLIVEEILDTADIVVKPLNQFLKSLTLYSGATVLGDGSVSLILDVIGLSQYANLTSDKAGQPGSFGPSSEESGKFEEQQEYLLFKLSSRGKFAIPLNFVHRLEEFNTDTIEHSGEQRVVRYRNSVLPILSLNSALKFKEAPRDSKVLPVIVVQRSGRSYGVEVQSIIDVATLDANIDDSIIDRKGILGNIISNQEIIVVVDILTILEKEVARLSPHAESGSQEDSSKIIQLNPQRQSYRILLAEDTLFFRKQISAVLTKAGFAVHVVNDGKLALDALNASSQGHYSVVLSDIEMPNLNGLQLAQSIRASEKLRNLPLIAITTKFSKRHEKEGLDAGFNRYLEKLNGEKLISALDKVTIEREEK